MVGGEEIGNTQPQLSVPVCVLTFAAPNHRHIWGCLARRSSSPSCLQRLKKANNNNKKQNKNKQTKKIQKKEERKESHPGFYFKPPRGEVAPCAWASLGSHQADLWAHRALFLSSALQCGMVLVGYGSGRVAKAVGTGQGV